MKTVKQLIEAHSVYKQWALENKAKKKADKDAYHAEVKAHNAAKSAAKREAKAQWNKHALFHIAHHIIAHHVSNTTPDVDPFEDVHRDVTRYAAKHGQHLSHEKVHHLMNKAVKTHLGHKDYNDYVEKTAEWAHSQMHESSNPDADDFDPKDSNKEFEKNLGKMVLKQAGKKPVKEEAIDEAKKYEGFNEKFPAHVAAKHLIHRWKGGSRYAEFHGNGDATVHHKPFGDIVSQWHGTSIHKEPHHQVSSISNVDHSLQELGGEYNHSESELKKHYQHIDHPGKLGHGLHVTVRELQKNHGLLGHHSLHISSHGPESHLKGPYPVKEANGIKGWKHAHSDIMKHRRDQSNAAKGVKLVRLNKDGKESGMHDATHHFNSEAEALAHHDNMKQLNPGKRIAHALYVGGEHKGNWIHEEVLTELSPKTLKAYLKKTKGHWGDARYTGWNRASERIAKKMDQGPLTRKYKQLSNQAPHEHDMSIDAVKDEMRARGHGVWAGRVHKPEKPKPVKEETGKKTVKQLLEGKTATGQPANKVDVAPRLTFGKKGKYNKGTNPSQGNGNDNRRL